jgi:hypothetical protein
MKIEVQAKAEESFLNLDLDLSLQFWRGDL